MNNNDPLTTPESTLRTPETAPDAPNQNNYVFLDTPTGNDLNKLVMPLLPERLDTHNNADTNNNNPNEQIQQNLGANNNDATNANASSNKAKPKKGPRI